MRDLNHDFKRLCQRNRDGSLATQHDRESILSRLPISLMKAGFGTCVRLACGQSMSSILSHVGTPKRSPRAPSRTACRPCAGWPRRSTSKTSWPAKTPTTASPSGAMSPMCLRRMRWMPTSWRPSPIRSRPCRCACKRPSGCGAKRASSCARPGRCAAAQGQLDQGRQRTRHPDFKRGATGVVG